MYKQIFLAMLFTALLHYAANADGMFPFVDGLWSGTIETDQNNPDIKACSASTTFDDGTIFTLAKRNDETWHLILSNPDWQLPPSRQYAMEALVDFYPRLRFTAEAISLTRLEIANLGRIALLEVIENGHTIDLASDGFNDKYDLEGSAKIIERIRNCFDDQLKVDSPASDQGARN